MRRIDEIEQLKNELISTVSHELKTPLATIKAYTATLRENPQLYSERRQEYLKIIEEQADRLSRLIDDLLMVSRVEAGQMLRRRIAVALDTVLDEAIAEIPFDRTLHPIERRTTGVMISGDPDRLRDLFRNLIENAVKYSPQGGAITITATQDASQTTVEISDSGIGVAKEDLPYIFDRFFRVQSESTQAVGGSGLGLYIVRALAHAHGGEIGVRSELGSGTTFLLRFPLRE